jgi:hypothetical protein
VVLIGSPRPPTCASMAAAAAPDPALAALLAVHPSLAITTDAASGRSKVRCSLTAHEIPARADAVAAYVSGKSYKHARDWYSTDFSKYAPWIVPHKSDARRLYCTLTRQPLNRIPEEVAAHVAGRRFRARLKAAEERAERKKSGQTVSDGESGDDDDEMLDDDDDNDEDGDEEAEEAGGSGRVAVAPLRAVKHRGLDADFMAGLEVVEGADSDAAMSEGSGEADDTDREEMRAVPRSSRKSAADAGTVPGGNSKATGEKRKRGLGASAAAGVQGKAASGGKQRTHITGASSSGGAKFKRARKQ